MELIQKSKVEAILGPETSSQAYFIVKVGEKAEVPIISFAPTISTLSYLNSPYFFRVAQNDSSQVYAITDIVKAYRWRQVVVIYQDDEFGKWILADLVDALHSIRVHRSIIDPTAFGDQIREELHRLSMMQTRVFIIHMMDTLASRVLAMANKLGMMNEGYVWILTDATTNALNTLNSSTLGWMQGVLGVKTYVPRTMELHNFITRWRRKFRQENPTMDDPQVDVYGLWAYDVAWALAMAVERIRTDPKSNLISRVYQNGREISKSLLKTKFKGLSGEFSLVKGKLESRNLEIVNVIGDGERTVGYWTPEMGLTRDFKRKGTRPIIWPGDSITVPKGWETSLIGEKKLKIGLALNVGFNEFALFNNFFTGYYVDIFTAVVSELPYDLPFEFIPFAYVHAHGLPSYNDLIMQVYEGKFDGAIGDITILANRSLYVDFTSPFSEDGIAVVVPVRRNLMNHAWLFLKPLTLDLWITSFFSFLLMGFVVWILEHQINEEFGGPPSHQIGTSLWFSFCTMVFAHREKLLSNLTRFVVVIWFFVVFILTQSYTASLTSWLTVQQLQPVTDINQIIKNNWRVGYQDGSYVLDTLKFLGIKNLVPYDSLEQLHELFTKGTCNDGIDAAIDEIPYLKLLLSRHPNDYTMADSIYKSNGFGFAFPIGSSLVDDMSKAMLSLTQSGKMNLIQEQWLGKEINSQSCSNSKPTSSSLDLSYFWSLFLIVAFAAMFALTLYFFRFLHNQRHLLRHIHFDYTTWRGIIAPFHILRMKNSRREGQIDAEPSMLVANASPTTNAPPRLPSNDSVQSDDLSLEPTNELGDTDIEIKHS